MVLRLICNLFKSPTATSYITSTQATNTNLIPRAILTTAVIENLLHEDTSAQQSAGSLSFNIARIIHDAYPDEEEWACEIVAAIGQGIEKTRDDEALLRLLATLGLLVQYAPASILDLCHALNMIAVIGKGVECMGSKNTDTSSKISQIGTEIIKMLEL
ncbi:hypothetical protein SeMB42_g07864 [Synchytrium endobioticum]|uniref:PUL domain-containing protein n=1 Tax=Synchytrium endobioticum TaxID=286115 RepID=A0A507BU71_9FUNG|nr:hypothetical protein SeMB42_g07864 [Synchytrium endobioticum]